MLVAFPPHLSHSPWRSLMRLEEDRTEAGVTSAIK